MSDITNVWLIAGTATSTDAQSSDTLELEFNLSDGSDVELKTDSSNRTDKWGSKGDKGDKGDAAIWLWDSSEISPSFAVSDVLSIDLETTGSNAWLPSNIFVIVEDSDGVYTLMAAYGAWPSDQCFSTDQNDCNGNAKAEYTLYSAT